MKLAYRWAWATCILTFLVIAAGSIVRTTQSGMGCPDWPTCFGRVIPPTDISQLPPDYEKYLSKQDIDHTFNPYHTWVEYINRLFGVLLGIFAIIQTILYYKIRKQYLQAYKASWWYLLIVILTGIFGALVVKLNLANISITVHMVFALLLAIISGIIIICTKRQHLFYLPSNKHEIGWTWILWLTLLIQMILGTWVRMYVDDVGRNTDWNISGIWLSNLPNSFILHRSFSWLVLAVGIIWFIRTKNIHGVSKNRSWLAITILLAMLAGITLYYADMPAYMQPVHLVLASIAITLSATLALSLKREKLVF